MFVILFVCVDDRMGMTFNSRRQSRDSVVTEKILEMSKGKTLWMNGYSAKMFDSSGVKISDSFLCEAGMGEGCFVETDDVSPFESKIEKIVLFKWNKVYPSDKKLNIDFGMFELKSSIDLEGTSHEKITCEVWER